MIDQFHHRLSRVEDELRKRSTAPTFPIYDVSHLPQDPVKGQIAIGTDGSINAYTGSSWITFTGTPSTGSTPQDSIDGQIVIGTDNSLCWRVGNRWLGVIGSLADGNFPQDVLDSQIAISNQTGKSNLCWYSDGSWYCVEAPQAVPYIQTGTNQHEITANTWYTIELHHDTSVGREFYIDGSLVESFSSFLGGVDAGAFHFGYPYNDFLSSPVDLAVHLQFRNLMIGSSRGSSSIFSDPLSSLPTRPPYNSFFPSGTRSIVGGVLDMQRSVSSQGIEVEYGGTGGPSGHNGSWGNPVWITMDVLFTDGLINWLSGASDSDPRFINGVMEVLNHNLGSVGPTIQLNAGYAVIPF